MILTGNEIEREYRNGRITIDPFIPEQVNPNSYNFRLGKTLRVYKDLPLDARRANEFEELTIPDDGYVLEPGRLYLAHTIEVLGSEHYAPTFAARSSVARLGLFINLSASLGDIGYTGQWTLQLYSMNRVRVYPGINVGQMMWWRPQGKVLLYDGKYQGSVGPRSSDIHVDFEKQFARQRFPGLGASGDWAEVGPKFGQLAAVHLDFPVPAAFCVPAAEFTAALDERQAAELKNAFTDVRATVGAFFTESLARITDTARGIRIPETTRSLLRTRLQDMFSLPGDLLAVRSSGLDEDGENTSLAGIHHSVLHVDSADAALEAIERCWQSHYEAPAVAARVRSGDFDAMPRLAVFVQRMIKPDLAGVAFTGLDSGAHGPGTPGSGAHGSGAHGSGAHEVTLEYVEGLADELVAGTADPVCVDSGSLESPGAAPAPHLDALRQVVTMVRGLRERAGHEIDVEWAADPEGVHLIQVRPVTARRSGPTTDDKPVLNVLRLYFDELTDDFELGAVAAVYSGYAAKRGPAHRLAHESGVTVGRGWVVRFNGRGLHDADCAASFAALLAEGHIRECVLDFGETLRQIVVPKEDVVARLAGLTGAETDSTALHSVVVRDFVRGRLGVISRRTAEGGLVVEYTDEGLMALNRGTAGGDTLLVADTTRPSTAEGNLTAADSARPLVPHLDGMARFTLAMYERYGDLTLEWVLDQDQLFFVDYSLLGGDTAVTVSQGEVCISGGHAEGPLLRLDDDELLRRLSIGPAVSIDKSQDVSEHEGLADIADRVRAFSEKPIIHAARPYAVLSVLLDDVAGFVFDKGSALGHLAILLREARIPAVSAADVHGTRAVITDGTVATTHDAPKEQ
ncbi:deoxycytidine triphosphate deaminase [Streptomyces sp. SID10853]|uniref:dCTP deaminase domain-containing protein n=1 Tax=Streptomyces sp. SID10853 TaxID=2706028 RepID=UPI0013C21D32|nr:PEP/pyruvate-binding domain-containing protein [Streptomyces sp. SID10853]NDZ78895.1 deoxycytidine triphosphate deaminase [Streptomyces sp. SID10853]